MGSPLHCTMIGMYRFASMMDHDEWLEHEFIFMSEGRSRVLDLLIELNADLTLVFTDPDGKDHSCAELALYAAAGKGVEHPFIPRPPFGRG